MSLESDEQEPDVMESAAKKEYSQAEPPDASLLEDRVPEWAQLSRRAVVWTVVLGLLWMFLCYHKLWHTDLWGHLAYGQVIVTNQKIPATEPLLPLAQGVPFQDTAWLSQVIGYGVISTLGVTGLQFLYALSVFLCVAALLMRFRSKTDSVTISVVGVGLFLLVAWKSLSIIRPQLAGLVCFVCLLCLLTRRHWSRWDWVLIPGLFAAWANLHGSFPVGLLLLGGMLAGRSGDVWLRTGNWRNIWRDSRVRQLFLVTELSLVALLLNPYGVGIFSAVVAISRNPNLRSLVEWDPVTLRMAHGQLLALSGVLLVVLYRLTPRRISLTEPVLLIGFGLMAMWTVRMVLWTTPLIAWFVVLHGQAVVKQRRKLAKAKLQQTTIPAACAEEEETESWFTQLSTRSGLNTVMVVGLIWIFFAYTPFGATVLHGYPQEAQAAERFYAGLVSAQTPVALTNYLQTHEPQGLVFNTYEWGDYLLWAGPAKMQIFLNSHAHLLPRDVWIDYLTIAAGNSSWRDKLDRYGVNTVVIDHLYRKRLIAELRQDPTWKLDYEDNVGVIFKRRIPIVVPGTYRPGQSTEVNSTEVDSAKVDLTETNSILTNISEEGH